MEMSGATGERWRRELVKLGGQTPQQSATCLLASVSQPLATRALGKPRQGWPRWEPVSPLRHRRVMMSESVDFFTTRERPRYCVRSRRREACWCVSRVWPPGMPARAHPNADLSPRRCGVLRSTCGARWPGPTRRTRPWRSTWTGTWTATRGWSRRSKARPSDRPPAACCTNTPRRSDVCSGGEGH